MGIENTPRIDFITAVQMGFVGGWTQEFKFGASEAIDVTEVGVYPGAKAFVWPTEAAKIQLSSSSADDTDGNGGSKKVTVVGLDSAGAIITEEIPLSGQTASTSTQSFYRINRMYVSDGLLNVGNLWASPTGATLTAGVPGDSDKLYEIAAGDGQSTQLQYTVPAKYRAYVYAINLGMGGDRTTRVRFRAKEPSDTCFRVRAKASLYRSPIAYPFPMVGHPGLTDIMITAKTSIAGSSDVAVTLSMLLREV